MLQILLDHVHWKFCPNKKSIIQLTKVLICLVTLIWILATIFHFLFSYHEQGRQSRIYFLLRWHTGNVENYIVKLFKNWHRSSENTAMKFGSNSVQWQTFLWPVKSMSSWLQPFFTTLCFWHTTNYYYISSVIIEAFVDCCWLRLHQTHSKSLSHYVNE